LLVTDLISRVRGLSARSEKWSHEAREVLESERKMSVHDVQDLLEAGERLNVKSNELKLLKEKLDRAQNWLNSVSAYTRGEIDVDVDAVNDLIEEHMSLIVELPEELEELRQTVVGYCLCRRPYEGFMIGCDHCDVSCQGLLSDFPLLSLMASLVFLQEWYHGSCIGVSESKAGKVEKFSCVRCELGQGARNSALAAIGLVKKVGAATRLVFFNGSAYTNFDPK
jgi:PLU-1-like protein